MKPPLFTIQKLSKKADKKIRRKLFLVFLKQRLFSIGKIGVPVCVLGFSVFGFLVHQNSTEKNTLLVKNTVTNIDHINQIKKRIEKVKIVYYQANSKGRFAMR